MYMLALIEGHMIVEYSTPLNSADVCQLGNLIFRPPVDSPMMEMMANLYHTFSWVMMPSK